MPTSRIAASIAVWVSTQGSSPAKRGLFGKQWNAYRQGLGVSDGGRLSHLWYYSGVNFIR